MANTTTNHHETTVPAAGTRGCLGAAWNNHNETALRVLTHNNNEAALRGIVLNDNETARER